MNQESGQLYSRHLATLAQRYSDALIRCGADRALIFSGAPRLRDRDDQALPFRPDPYFLQWAPLSDSAESVIEFRVGHQPRLVFVANEDFWHARVPPPPESICAEFEVVLTTTQHAAKALNRSGERTVVIGQDTCGAGGDMESPPFLEILDFERAVKTAYEVDCIRLANHRAAAGHRAVAAALRTGVSEFELHMQYCLASMHSEDQLPYPSIVGLNEHAAILHYQHRETEAPPTTHSALIDAGAQVNGYAADVTRTYSLSDRRFAELIEATTILQQRVSALVIAGTDFVALNERCHEFLAQLLVEFEFVRCTAETAYDKGVTTAFLPHGLGHLLGLQVHDVGGHSVDDCGTLQAPPDRHPYLRLTRMLEPDMVITIEPGIYFIGSLLEELERKTPGLLRHDKIEAFMPFGGIRIEDNVRVKSDGHDNLTLGAFSD